MSTNEPDPTFAEAVSEDIAALKMTQDQIGETLGVTQQAVSRWARGYPPANDRVIRLASLRGPESKLWAWLKSQGVDATPEPHTITQTLAAIAPVLGAAAAPALGVASMVSAVSALTGGALFRKKEASTLHELAVEFHRKTIALLPGDLRPNFDSTNARVYVGGLARRFDYVSDKLIAEFRVQGGIPIFNALEGRLLALAAARQATLQTHPNRQYLIVVVMHGPTSHSARARAQSFMTDASLLGVHVVFAATPAAAAHFITQVEKGRELQDVLEEEIEEGDEET